MSATVDSMNSATAWNVTGVGRETRAFAEEAARRAGMSLGDWLDEVVADKAAEQGVEPADLERDDRLDAIGERISRLSRREEAPDEGSRSRSRDEPRRERGDREPSRDETRRAEALLEAAIARLESRAERTEGRAARAFESMAQWIERSQADRGEQRAALQAVAERLAAIDQRTARQQSLLAEGPRRLESRLEETERDLDARMSALARRLEAVQERRREPPRASERPRIDVQEAVSQIARRRSELDSRASAPDFDAPRRGWRNLAADPAPSPPAAAAAPEAGQAPPPSPPPVEAPAAPAARGPAANEGLRNEIIALSLRLDQMRREQSEQRAQPPVDVQGLRAELAAMSRSLADLAPRNAVVALEGAMRDLSERIAAMRDNGARDALVAPLETLIGQLRDALRAHDPQAAVNGLAREIRAIDAKVDAIAQGAVNPATFERIRSQTEEVRNLLAAAALRPVPVERLEKQIGDLADRVERLTSNPAPQAETARVMALLADARAQIERSTPAAALSAIERRLEQLAQRMDQALQRPQPAPSVDSRAIEDLARRIDGVRASIERQTGAQPDAAKLEAALRDLSQKLDRPPAPAANPDALAAMIRDLGARIDQRAHPSLEAMPLEQAPRSPGDRPIAFDTTAIENLMRDLGAKLAAASAADMRPLEDLLREINHKLDRGAAAATAPGEIAAMIRDLGARIDQRAQPTLDVRPLEQALRALGDRPIAIDTTPIENLMRDLEAKLAASNAVDMRPLEDLLREINHKLDRGAAAAMAPGEIEAMIRDLGARIDQRVAPTIDTRPLEEALRALHDRIDLGAAEKVDPKFVEQAADLFVERLGRRDGAGVDADALASQILEIHDRLDALHPDALSNGALERKVGDIHAELEAMRTALQSLPATARDNDEIVGGLANLRAEQSSADKRTQARLANLQDILERIVNRLGRVEDEVARVEESARAHALDPASAARKVSSAGAGEALNATGAALRDIPDRAAERPARNGRPSQAGEAPPPRALEGGDFLLEPGSTLTRPRNPDAADFSTPKSAVNAHIAAARRAAQAAMAESATKDRNPKQAAESAAKGERAHAAAGAQAIAFLAARRRPILLGVALLVLIATFAVVGLRGGRQAAMQKSDLQAPVQTIAKPDMPKLGSLTGGNDARAVDPDPVGSIAAPPSPAGGPKAAPADLAASIPPGLPPSLRDAATAGDAPAAFELASRLIDGRGVAKDPRAAAQWFEQAAGRDLPIAEYRLAALYEKGIGVTRDPSLAMSWYAKAATAGNARAMHNLAVMNAEGALGGKPDYAEAAQWFGKAGQLGIRDSQFNLGILYARGMGVAPDLVQSWLWFSLAGQQGDPDALKKRDEVAAKMDAPALLAAAKALAQFKASTPSPAANDAPTPPGGWDAKPAAPQAGQAPARAGAAAL